MVGPSQTEVPQSPLGLGLIPSGPSAAGSAAAGGEPRGCSEGPGSVTPAPGEALGTD